MHINELEKALKEAMRLNPGHPSLALGIMNGQLVQSLPSDFSDSVRSLGSKLEQRPIHGRSMETEASPWA